MSDPVTSRERLARNIRISATIVVLVVGVLGGYTLWQICCAQHEYVVAVEVEFDPTGAGNASVVRSEQLLERLGLEVSLGAPGVVLAVFDPPYADPIPVRVKGRAQRQDIEAGQARARLRHRDADPDQLWMDLGLATQNGDTLRYVLGHAAADAFLERRIETLVSVRNQFGDPVPGLRAPGQNIKEDAAQAGVYRVGIDIDELLYDELTGEESMQFRAVGEDKEYRLEVPYRWFRRAKAEQHVVSVEEEKNTELPSPQPAGFSPTRAVARQWDGALVVTGVDLDLVEEYRLRSGDRSVARGEVSGDNRSLRVNLNDPRSLGPGSYELVLESRTGEMIPVPGRLRLRGAFEWLAPGQSAVLERGSALDLRWRAGGLGGDILVEVQRQGGDGGWLIAHRGPVAAGSAQWATEGLEAADEGQYILRATLIDQPSLRPIERRWELTGPERVEVVIRFMLDGRRFGNIQALRIDDERVDLSQEADPALIRTRLAPGEHQIRVEGTLVQPHTEKIFVDEAGKRFDIQLQR